MEVTVDVFVALVRSGIKDFGDERWTMVSPRMEGKDYIISFQRKDAGLKQTHTFVSDNWSDAFLAAKDFAARKPAGKPIGTKNGEGKGS